MKILITDKIDDSALDLLRSRGFQLEVEYKAEPVQLEQLASGADGWIIRSGTNITPDLLEKAQHLKVIGRAGVGVDNIDVEAATRKGIAVLNTPTGNTMAAVEHSMAMLLALARHIPEAHQSLITEGSWERAKFTGVELYGKTIGVLGLGKIGARVAARCLAMEMTVLGYDPYLSEDQAVAMNVELVADLDQLFGRCDFLSLHLPSTESTRGLIDGDRLKQCKPGVRLVNCARGTLVDERALAEALASGQVAGAALDVFENEPPFDSPLIGAPNLVATPHLGASTRESQRNVGLLIAEQVADALDRGIFREAVNIPVSDWQTYDRLKPQLELVERMGSLAQQHADGAISEVQIEYCGEGFDELDAINNTLLQGLLGAVAETTVNAVNAPVLARERGIALSFTESDADAGYRQLVRLRVRVGNRYHSFSATTFFDGEPRLVEIDGFSVELILTGVLIIFGNYDKPGVIGGLGSIFGEHGINIAHFSLGRRRRGGEAMGILAVDERVDDGILALIAELPNMQWVSQIVLD